MKKLSLTFGIIAVLFLSFGLYELFYLSDLNCDLILSCYIGGFASSILFVITDKLSKL